MAEHEVSPWYCVGCGTPREVEQFGEPCACGNYAIACDESHYFTHEELREFARRLDALKEVRKDEG
jgi:hypothetical protein